MKIFSNTTVLEATKERIRFLFDEFPNILIGVSGGKDSSVCFEISLEVAREKGRLPLDVFFLDQEAEWEATIEQITYMMTHPDVKPWWLQIPMVMSNATSQFTEFLKIFDPAEEHKWVHPKHPLGMTENVYGTNRFAELFPAIIKHHFPGKKACYIAGLTAEESPTRTMALTQDASYKWITWAKRITPDLHYTFYPIYDWSITDVWKYIHDHDVRYCKVYDMMYHYGVKLRDMRVSNVHHETAIRSLFYMQEFEPDNWNRLVERLSGINTAGMNKMDLFYVPKTLPKMFKDWEEYYEHLRDNLIVNEKLRGRYKRRLETVRKKMETSNPLILRDMFRQFCITILSNDIDMTKIGNWSRRPEIHGWRKLLKTGVKQSDHPNKYVEYEIAYDPDGILAKHKADELQP